MTEEEKRAAAVAAAQSVQPPAMQPPSSGDRQGPPTHLQSRASFQPKTFNPETRTVEIVFSVGSRGLRHGWDSSYYEELSMDQAAVRMERLNNGAPLLNSHGQYDLADVIGVVENARIEGGKGVATVRFSEREDVEPIFQDVKAGILRNISVGYQVHKWERVQEEGSKYPIFRATDWEPQELSFVPVGFDAAAQVRSAATPKDDSIRPTRANTQQENTVTEDEKKAAEAAKQAAEQEATRKAATEAATVAERKRAADIRSAVRAAKLDDTLAETMVNEGVEMAVARERIIARLAETNPAAPTHTSVQMGDDAKDHAREGMVNAILHRANPGAEKLTDKGRAFRGLSMLEMARDALEASGVKTRGLAKMDVAARALHSTSDFPLILADVTSKSLRKQYDGAPKTFQQWARRASAPDFRAIKRLQLGDAPSLEKVNEAGEFKSGTMTEGQETYSILTYGKVIGITRQALVNDDIGAFTRIPELFGRAAADLESSIVYNILLNNAAMSDAVALFHATHGNLGTAGAPSVTTLSEARKLMRKQKNLAGRPINIAPKTLIVGPDQETVAQQFLNTDFVPAQPGNINPFAGNLTLVVDALITNFNWFLAASPDQVDTVEYAYLEGEGGVVVETQMGFKVDGVEMKVRHDFGAGAIDYRGLVKNAATS